MSKKDLSRLARRGSGSASKYFGGFAEWEKGHDDETSYAHAIDANDWENELSMVFVVINDKSKKVSRRSVCLIQDRLPAFINIG